MANNRLIVTRIDPLLSVVVASYNDRATITGCLKDLQGQTYRPLEVIVVDSSSDGTGELVQAEFPEVLLLREATRMYPGDARNRGIARSRGDIIALLDADCRVEPDWAQRLVALHRRPEPVIGTAIAARADFGLVAWAAYFCKCTRWAPESPPRPMSDLPACTLSFKRWVFEDCGPFLEGTYCSDTAFSWAVARRGHTLWFEPSIRVSHRYYPRLPAFLTRQIWHGKTFARVRCRWGGLPRWRRLALGLGSPLLPLLLFQRILSAVLQHRIAVRRFALAFPLVWAGLMAWSAGEACGYLENL